MDLKREQQEVELKLDAEKDGSVLDEGIDQAPQETNVASISETDQAEQEVDFASAVLEKQQGTSSHPLEGRSYIGGKYRILGLLGRGGLGSVYKVEHSALQRMQALKVLNPDVMSERKVLQRFDQEAKAVSQLSHRNLLAVHDFGVSDDGLAYLVMDLIEGTGLDAELHKNGHLEEERAIALFIKVCEGLHYAHGKGIVHRDLKPSNIMIVKDEHGQEIPKIVDFGIAKRQAVDQKVTQTGEVFGTPLYMSPEQCLGKEVDGRSDIYSLGCVLYQTLSGNPPFESPNAVQTIFKHVNEEAKPLRKACTGFTVSLGIEQVVAKCLEKDPAKRFANASQLAAALEKVLHGDMVYYFRAPIRASRFTQLVPSIVGILYFSLFCMMVIGVIWFVMWMPPLRDRALDMAHQAPPWMHTKIQAENAVNSGNWKTATDLWAQALKQAKEAKVKGPELQGILEQCCLGYSIAGEFEKAHQLYTEAADEAHNRKDFRQEEMVLAGDATSLNNQGQYDEAAKVYKRMEGILDQANPQMANRIAFAVLAADAFLRAKEYPDAEQLMRKYESKVTADLGPELKYSLYRDLAYALQGQEKYREALPYYEKAELFAATAKIADHAMSELRKGHKTVLRHTAKE